jgi:hypothetical protein
MMSALTYEQLVPFSLVFGYTTESNDQYGSWYYGETAKKLKTGNMIVTKTGEIYNIVYEFYDRIGSKVSGTYSGTLEYTDGTKSSSVKASKVKKPLVRKSFSGTHKKVSKIKPLKFVR